MPEIKPGMYEVAYSEGRAGTLTVEVLAEDVAGAATLKDAILNAIEDNRPDARDLDLCDWDVHSITPKGD